MNREEYIKLRKSGNFVQICFIFYTELCNEKGVKPLDYKVFSQAFPVYLTFVPNLIDLIVEEYDIKFSLMIISKDNKIIDII
jgi:hypothetical protein